jgi:uncharacterized membrane protein HdeD (DUF308 family)
MVAVLARNWRLMVFRGVAAILFSALTFIMPAITLGVLILLFGAYALVDGLFTIMAAVRDRRGEGHWVAFPLGGIVSVLIGIVAFVAPGVTGFVLLYLIAWWAIVTGIGQIAAATRLRRVISGEWLLFLAGVLSVGFGLVLVLFPGAGALAVTLWIGAYALALGIVLIALGFRLRRWDRERGTEAVHPM